MARGKTKNKYLIYNGVAVSHKWYQSRKLQRIKRLLTMSKMVNKRLLVLSENTKNSFKNSIIDAMGFSKPKERMEHNDYIDAVAFSFAAIKKHGKVLGF